MTRTVRTRRSRSRVLKLAGALALAATIVVLAAAPASAHAVLLKTDPSGSTTVPTSPERLDLTFSENVEISLGSIKLFDQKGNPVGIGAPHHAASTDREIQADVPHLTDGAYVVTWRVISADAHPVHGAFTFAVGRSSGDAQALATRLEAKAGGNRLVGVLFGITRAAEFAGIALLLGAVVFAAAIRPHGRRRSRADVLVWTGWITLFVSTIAGVLLQGPYASALPVSNAFHTNVVRAVLRTRYGHVAELRLVLLLAALPLLFLVRKTWRPPAWWWLPAAPLGVGIALTPGLAGHASNGIFTGLAIPLDALHVTAMSLWLGGLASLAFIVLDRDPDARRTAERFSPVAFSSVVLILGSGIFASWRQVGWSTDAFTGTTFGRLLVVKVGTFVVLVALAAWSRRVVRARRPATLSAAVATSSETSPAPQAAPADPEARNLRWSVGGELLFGVAVLVITSLLVNAQPARSVLALPFSTELRDPAMLVDVTIDPAQVGPVVIHIYTLTPSGANQYIQNATATISLPSKGIAPLEVPLERAGPSHFRNTGFRIPFSGKWLLVVRAFKTEVDEVAVQTTVDIR